MKNNYEEYIKTGLDIINKLLIESQYNYSDYSYTDSEGRICSIQGEDDFLNNLLKKNFIEYQKNTDLVMYQHKNDHELFITLLDSRRSWYDFGILYKKQFFPINIKIANGTTKDNLFGVKVLDYLLFGNINIDKDGVHNIIQRNEESVALDIYSTMDEDGIIDIYNPIYNLHNIRDYFFLSINKMDNSVKIFPFFNLKAEDISVNPKNAFQVNFSNLNYKISENDLNFEQNILKLLIKYFEYTEKKARPYMILNGII